MLEHKDSSADKEREPYKVRIGFGVVIVNPEGKILLGRRRNFSGYGEWAIPGGWFEEEDDDLAVAAAREVLEETGIKIGFKRDFEIISVDNSRFLSDRVINFGLRVDTKDVPKETSPGEIGDWTWFDRNSLPEPIFEPSKMTLLSLLTGRILVGLSKDVMIWLR